MPIYRVNGMLVHMKLGGPKSKWPKPCCARIPAQGRPGTFQCLAISTIACDWQLEDGGTCDAPLCAEHAHEIGPDLHLCPIHLERQKAGEKELP